MSAVWQQAGAVYEETEGVLVQALWRGVAEKMTSNEMQMKVFDKLSKHYKVGCISWIENKYPYIWQKVKDVEKEISEQPEENIEKIKELLTIYYNQMMLIFEMYNKQVINKEMPTGKESDGK